MAKRVFTEEERAVYREKMLDAGFDLLKQYGMTHMSVAKITEAAGIGVSTFYNFFPSKEAYVYEVIKYRRKIIPNLMNLALNGKEKAGPDETKNTVYFQASLRRMKKNFWRCCRSRQGRIYSASRRSERNL